MADISLHIEDPLVRITVKPLLEAAGHRIVETGADLRLCDRAADAAARAKDGPTLLLANAQDAPRAVDAMRQGVYGYALLPLVPGEIAILVERALGHARQDGAAAEDDPDAFLSLDEWEARHILATLRRCRYNQAEAARRLGIGRNTLWRKLKRFRGESA